jgi:hypothetical protein
MLAVPDLLNRSCVQHVLTTRSRNQIGSTVVQRIVVIVIDLKRVRRIHSSNHSMHADGCVAPVDRRIPDGVHIVPIAVWLGLPSPLRQVFDHVVVDDRMLMRTDSVFAGQPDQSHVPPK